MTAPALIEPLPSFGLKRIGGWRRLEEFGDIPTIALQSKTYPRNATYGPARIPGAVMNPRDQWCNPNATSGANVKEHPTHSRGYLHEV
jgi:hypothetical protein